MSETDDMWDRFFRGSKYERKWLRNRHKPIFPAETRSHEIEFWLARLAAERAQESPTAEKTNPFDRLQQKRGSK